MANSLGSNGQFLSGQLQVSTAGTAEAIVTSGKVLWNWVKIVAQKTNTGQVYVGGSDVASTTNDGMDAKQELILFSQVGFDLSDIYVDVDTNGEGIDIYAWVE